MYLISIGKSQKPNCSEMPLCVHAMNHIGVEQTSEEPAMTNHPKQKGLGWMFQTPHFMPRHTIPTIKSLMLQNH